MSSGTSIINNNNVTPKEETVYAYLPNDIYCAVGRTIEIYDELVCLNSYKYHIRWNCDIGHALIGKYSVTGMVDFIGNHTLSFTVYDDDKTVLYEKNAVLHIVNAAVPSTTLATLGDSNSCGKFWQYEICGLSNDNIALVGARSFHSTYNGKNKSIKVDGRGGFSTTRYLSGYPASVDYSDSGAESPHHALYDPAAEKFSWKYYVDKSLNGISPNNVNIMLGTNELGKNIDAFLADYKTIVDNIREDDPKIKILIAPCVFSGTQDGIGYQGNVEGYSKKRGAWQYDQDMAVWKQNKGLHDTFAGYDNLFFIETAITMDRWHGYRTEQITVNPRSSEKIFIQKESVHPTSVGYGQMADIIFSTLCGV